MSLDNGSFFLSFYKDPGITSAGALDKLKRALKLPKAGHCGTLDPMAEGLLVVAVNRATKLMRFITDEPKRYVGRFEIGKKSPSYDSETPVEVTAPDADTSQVDWQRILSIFSGRIRQTPPAYSAVRVDGVRSYRLARKGQLSDLPPKEVVIHSLVLKTIDRTTVGFTVECSKGTYIRSLVHDIGLVAGTGAVLVQLTREAVGRFTVAEAVRLDDLRTAPDKVERAKLPLPAFLRRFPSITVNETLFWQLRNGVDIRSLGLPLLDGPNTVLYNDEPLFLLEKEGKECRYTAYFGSD
ncbi:MAG TPA: tRNA pseudouridine(55) synthase TruB [bacterium]|nr:tRNA pseudouridine(55) synthase TruB [bacterium]